jgi:hypothetical protein
MIMNLRPTKEESLNTVVEQMEDRYSDEQQAEIVAIIAEVLGTPDGEAERQAMTDSAMEARKGRLHQESLQIEAMETEE